MKDEIKSNTTNNIYKCNNETITNENISNNNKRKKTESARERAKTAAKTKHITATCSSKRCSGCRITHSPAHTLIHSLTQSVTQHAVELSWISHSQCVVCVRVHVCLCISRQAATTTTAVATTTRESERKREKERLTTSVLALAVLNL